MNKKNSNREKEKLLEDNKKLFKSNIIILVLLIILLLLVVGITYRRYINAGANGDNNSLINKIIGREDDSRDSFDNNYNDNQGMIDRGIGAIYDFIFGPTEEDSGDITIVYTEGNNQILIEIHDQVGNSKKKQFKVFRKVRKNVNYR